MVGPKFLSSTCRINHYAFRELKNETKKTKTKKNKTYLHKSKSGQNVFGSSFAVETGTVVPSSYTCL